MKKIRVLTAILLVLALMGAAGAIAQEEWKPSQTIRIYLGFSAGGGIDAMCRTAAPAMAEYLGVDVIVENMPGASSGIATDYVHSQPADGYSILGTSSSMCAFSTTENSDASYLQLDMLAMPFVVKNTGVVVNAKLGIDTMEDFIKYVTENNTIASTAGVGSMWHIPAAKLAETLGCLDKVTFVPYDSGNKTALAVAQGEADWSAVDTQNAGEYMKGGLCKMLCVFSSEPFEYEGFGSIPAITDFVPEIADSADILGGWRGFAVSKDTPDHIKQKLTEAFTYAVNTDQFKELLKQNNIDAEKDVVYGAEAQEIFEHSSRVSSYLLYDLGDGTRNPEDVGVLRWE